MAFYYLEALSCISNFYFELFARFGSIDPRLWSEHEYDPKTRLRLIFLCRYVQNYNESARRNPNPLGCQARYWYFSKRRRGRCFILTRKSFSSLCLEWQCFFTCMASSSNISKESNNMVPPALNHITLFHDGLANWRLGKEGTTDWHRQKGRTNVYGRHQVLAFTFRVRGSWFAFLKCQFVILPLPTMTVCQVNLKVVCWEMSCCYRVNCPRNH